jgi:hypothetical protein
MAAEVGAETVLLAHHQRDQAETVLLQALRGAGPAGLAGMPRVVERQGIRWVRPWLDQPASAIAHYVRRHRCGTSRTTATWIGASPATGSGTTCCRPWRPAFRRPRRHWWLWPATATTRTS